MSRARRWVRRSALAGAAASGTVLAAALVGTPAHADAPTQVGWWSDAPSPTTPAGGIHVAVAPQRLLAYGAVLFPMPATGTATLTLKIAGSHGSGAIVACPTTTTTWKPGDDQPMNAAPAYDCSAHAVNGLASSDGTSVTFLVDGSVEPTPGTLSLAILPLRTTGLPVVGTDAGTDVTQPYAVDIAKPDASALTVTGGAAASAVPPAAPPPATPPAAAGTTGAAPGTAVPAGAPVSIPGAAAGSVPSDAAAGAAPVLAGQTNTPGAVTPVAARTSTVDHTARNAALALLLLLAVAVVGGTSTPRQPRRLGARGAAVAPPEPVFLGTRGLGRFARPRTTPPRPLT